MSKETTVEFYHGDTKHPFVSVKSSAVPRKGEFVSIHKTSYRITGVTWAVDHAGTTDESLRAVVSVEIK